MPYLGNTPSTSFATVVKDTFNGGSTGYTLSKVATTNSVSVFVENVRQEPTTAYAVSGTTLTFTATTPSGTGNIYVLHMNPTTTTTHPAAQNLTAVDGTFTGNIDVDGTANLDVVDIDGAVDMASTLGVTGNVTLGGTLDMNGAELILDADADTSITADTDDRIDFRTAGSDRMKINSNGSVGIGTATTTGDLNISPVVGSYTTIQMTSGGATTGNIIYFGDSTDADYSSITAFGSNAGETGRMRFIAGTSEAMNIYNNGAIKKPANPAFFAGFSENSYYSVGTTNGTKYKFAPYTNENQGKGYNIGSHFDNSNDRFTAPISGRYHFAAQFFTNYASNYMRLGLDFYKNGSHYHSRLHPMWEGTGSVYASVIMSLATNDYVEVYARGQFSSGTYTIADDTNNGFSNGNTFVGFRLG